MKIVSEYCVLAARTLGTPFQRNARRPALLTPLRALRTMRLWSASLRTALAAYRGHLFPVWDVASCPRGLYAATASADRTARLWSTEHPNALRIFAGEQRLLPPSRLPDVSHKTENIALCTRSGHAVDFATCCALASLFTSRVYPRVFHDLPSCRAVKVISKSSKPTHAGHSADVDVVRWHPNCQYLATGSTDRCVALWDVREGDRVRRLVSHRAEVSTCSVLC